MNLNADQIRESSASSGLCVRVIRSEAEIEEIRDSWAHWQSDPNADIDYYLTVLRLHLDSFRPYILALCHDDRPIAILVGRVEQSRLEFRIGYKALFRPRVRQLVLIKGGRLGDLSEQNCTLLVSELVRGIKRDKIDVVFFNHLRTDLPLYKSIAQLPGVLTRDRYETPVTHRSMALAPTIEDIYRGLSVKARYNLKSRAKKLLAAFPGAVTVRTYSNASELDRMFSDVEAVAKNTYQRGLGAGFSDTDEMRTRVSLETQKSWFRANVLYISEKPAAFWIGNLYGDTFHSNYMGYDAQYSKYSPGMFLVMSAIGDLVGQTGPNRPAKIDWGLGDAEYKQALSTEEWLEASPRIFAQTMKGMMLSLLWTATMSVDRTARKLLGKAGMIQKVKAAWRGRLRKASEPLSQAN